MFELEVILEKITAVKCLQFISLQAIANLQDSSHYQSYVLNLQYQTMSHYVTCNAMFYSTTTIIHFLIVKVKIFLIDLLSTYVKCSLVQASQI